MNNNNNINIGIYMHKHFCGYNIQIVYTYYTQLF